MGMHHCEFVSSCIGYNTHTSEEDTSFPIYCVLIVTDVAATPPPRFQFHIAPNFHAFVDVTIDSVESVDNRGDLDKCYKWVSFGGSKKLTNYAIGTGMNYATCPDGYTTITTEYECTQAATDLGYRAAPKKQERAEVTGCYGEYSPWGNWRVRLQGRTHSQNFEVCKSI